MVNKTLTGQTPECDAWRDADGGLSVFAYGSLVWDPGFAFIARRAVWLRGYHRRFCILSVHYRGTPAAPGLVLGLDRGGSCHGVLYRVAPADVPETLAYLWRRELVTDVYTPRRLRLGKEAALGFVARRDHAHYRPQTQSDQARIIAGARGPRGSNLDYLRNTVMHLRALGLRDRGLERLLAAVSPGAV